MADSHLQVNYDGTISDERTNLLPNNKELKTTALTQLFSINNWSVKSIDNPSSCLWKIIVSNSEGSELKINILLSSIRDEARQPDEFKTQFGGKIDFASIEEGWINIPLGVYLKEENAPLDKWLFAAFSMDGINFLGNPSFRGVRTKGLQLAQYFGFIENDSCIIFRPEFIYHIVNLYARKQSNEYNTKFSDIVAEAAGVYISYPLPLQKIFFGAPGVGKSHHLKSVYKNEDDVIRITFHPETDYASFVGCYKPQSDGKDIVYKFQGQAFAESYVKAWRRYVGNEERKDTFLVIEEINRGNCAQIFGDIFQLLDRDEQGFSDYSVIPDKDLQSYLESQFKDIANDLEKVKKSVAEGTSMVLPPNLHILATMNTSDQSLFPIDSAFKRRWDWVYMPIDTNPTNSEGKPFSRKIHTEQFAYDWGTFLTEVNARIYTTTLSEDKQLGFWFVKPKGQDGIISASDFVSKVVFFLWNDIYKDYVDDATSIFNFSADGNPDSKDKVRHTFRDFTPKFQHVNHSLIDAFLMNLGIKRESLKAIAANTNETPLENDSIRIETEE